MDESHPAAFSLPSTQTLPHPGDPICSFGYLPTPQASQVPERASHPTRDSMSGIISSHVTESTMIGTMSRTSLMDLPAEIRIKIFEYLLAFPDGIIVPTPQRGGKASVPVSLEPNKHPTVGVLQTCKLINIEATPIFYSINRFVVSLKTSQPEDSPITKRHTFKLSHFRWSTLAQIKSLTFVSGNNVSLMDEPGSRAGMVDASGAPIPSPPSFACNGMDILDRFSVSDRQYSPGGPDEYMALSLSNWVSMKVMSAELSAFQKELEIMMRAVPPVAAALPVHVPGNIVQDVELLAEVEIRT